MRVQFQIQGFDDQKLEEFNSWIFFYLSKIAIYLSLDLHKGHTQATGEAFSPQKKTSST
jgi:hypothetical protein